MILKRFLPGNKTLPKSVRLRNFFPFWEINWLIFFISWFIAELNLTSVLIWKTVLPCNLHWRIGAFPSFKFKFQNWWVNIFQKCWVNVFFRKRENDCFVFPPHQLSALSEKSKNYIFSRQARPCIKSSQILKKKTSFDFGRYLN